MSLREPAPRPCESCPYRLDVPSGVWDRSEYERLPAYDRDTATQPMAMFACHQADGRLCAGWVGCHDMTNSLALRFGYSLGHITRDTWRRCLEYVSPVPLFRSGAEACEHGVRDVDHPRALARRLVAKLSAKQSRRRP